jgi:16S rRNA U1498 N3-methylase RsmE
MQIHRFYSDSLIGSKVELEGTEAHHLSALCLGHGAQVMFFDENQGPLI